MTPGVLLNGLQAATLNEGHVLVILCGTMLLLAVGTWCAERWLR